MNETKKEIESEKRENINKIKIIIIIRRVLIIMEIIMNIMEHNFHVVQFRHIGYV